MAHKTLLRFALLCASLFAFQATSAMADSYADALKSFKSVKATQKYFETAYGYALFPTIGKAGFVLGGAYGEGKVYRKGVWVGDSTMVQGTIGFQLGGQAFSELIFFKNKDAFEEFISEGFEFGAQATVVAITAGASASAGTTGTGTGASGGTNNATGKADYYRGMATFTIAKGGLMYEATLGGQKFTFKPKRHDNKSHQ
ncbi:MAG: lipid-binding SYLF domain-containing protein [Hydrogenovibrio sp.]|nr:lipid-binding SYLF domain-containing protein [Hydrogenovibrio sp.]